VIVVTPPPDAASGAAASAPTPRTSTSSTSSAEAGTPLPGGVGAALDRADIRPLDVLAALQILVAEVRAAFTEALSADSEASADLTAHAGNAGSAGSANAGNSGSAAAADLDGAVPAARFIVEMALQSLPERFEPGAWSVALPRMDLALQTGVQRAVDVVAAWRDVMPEVLSATQESGALALRLIADEPPYPAWPAWPPREWLGLAPRLARLWRRRRALKRRLVDPDHAANTKWDELDELGS
jgi:hypothetical protein